MIALSTDKNISSPSAFLDFYSGQKRAKVDFSFALKGSGFQTEQHIGNVKQISRASIIKSLWSPKIS